ncbi:MAG: amidohydrolase [Phascolarctobacterium sp.]|nr:amidohydrolase [Phascolarctobacterium sp.]MBQ7760364.1 amidohydrolase [Acidaminococcaceae bacterium]
MSKFIDQLADSVKKILPYAEEVYKDLHQHPELSLQENRTSKIVASHLKDAGFQVTEHVGVTGVVGLMKNGDGPTIMLRSDMDALPMKEESSVPYASKCEAVNAKGETVPVAHTCGHDLHITWLLSAATILSRHRELWQGTLLVVFQPAEETAQGSAKMIEDGITSRFPKPDVILGQHLLQYRAGKVGYRPGQILTAGDSMLVRFFGRGAHGGMPQNGIDPIVMASAAVLRLQTIVSREVAPQAQVAVTIGEFHAGTAENIIAETAEIKLNVRNTDATVREHVLDAIKRICVAEAHASNAPKDPEFEPINNYPLTVNDVAATSKIAEAFKAHFGDDAFECPPVGASEDFARFGLAFGSPYVYWFVGGTDQAKYDAAVKNNTVSALPGPHSPFWAPAIEPTLRTGIETMLIAAGVWLAK